MAVRNVGELACLKRCRQVVMNVRRVAVKRNNHIPSQNNQKRGIEMFAVNDRVKLTGESGLFPENKNGTIVDVDENDEMMPYKVKFDGDVIGIWILEGEIELLKEEE